MPPWKRRVLFVGWDAADWKTIRALMDEGNMPNLKRLIDRGSWGRCATLTPPLSPMLWTSIATGKRPFKHGIHGFSEPTPDGLGVRPITNLSRTAKAVWNILNQNGLRSQVIGWWPSSPAEPINGVMVTDHYHKAHGPLDQPWTLPPHTVYPPELAETLATLRVHPGELAGPMIAAFVPEWEKIDSAKDRRLSMLLKTIAECVSVHSAATWLIENQPWDFFAVYFDAIDQFGHGFMRYHPPRQEWVKEEDFEIFSNVIATAYRLQDRMLGTLLAKVDEDTTVILMSDHGFHPGRLRPVSIPDFPAGPAVEHSPYGIFVIAGAGIKKDGKLFGVSVLDLAPTVLALYGLPAGRDMDGSVVEAAFENPSGIPTVPSWEDVAGDDGRHPPDTRMDPVVAAEALNQLVALGYIEKPGDNIEEYIELTVRELRFNLMEAYQDAHRHSEALNIARELCQRDANDQRYALKRFLSCQALGLTGEMREIVDDMQGRRRKVFEGATAHMRELRERVKRRYEEKKIAAGEAPDAKECEVEIWYEIHPLAAPRESREFLLNPEERRDLAATRKLARYTPAICDLLEAQMLADGKRWFEALAAVQRLERAGGERPSLLSQSADLLCRLHRVEEAEQLYRRALEIDPDNVQAHLGLCRVALRRRDFESARQASIECVGRLYFYPMAHLLGGVARVGLRDYEGAAACFRTALSQNPHFPQAHVRLGRLLKFRLKDAAGAREHFHWYREMRERRPDSVEMGPREEQLVSTPAMGISGVLPPLGADVLVVSGLPRSGTSMLMQMLDAGGMPILTDGVRAADVDNPKGYFEFEAVKRMFREQGWVDQARGKALKVVAPLVCALPEGCRYRVLLIERDYDEILESQEKMMRRWESVNGSQDRRERLRREYSRIVALTKTVLAHRTDVQLMTVLHEDVIRDPAAAAEEIARLAGWPLDLGKMAAAVDRGLHRNRRTAGMR